MPNPLDVLSELHGKATLGEWALKEDGVHAQYQHMTRLLIFDAPAADLAWIAASKNLFPAVRDEVERLMEVERLAYAVIGPNAGKKEMDALSSALSWRAADDSALRKDA